ncbi:MAG TPA: hypothetical protein VFN50_13255 [Acidimicrobiales bacterium]|nr:hypothetical protein [Acidimicrobiales bacterium]
MSPTRGPARRRVGRRADRLAARVRSWRDWGATDEERATVLPGDDLVPAPAASRTQAVSIGAPAGAVWRWLVQIGQDRGGMYSYDALENLLGLRIHSSDEVRPEWQHLAPGDRVRLVPAGWLGLKDGLSLPAVIVDPPRSLVLREAPPEMPWNAVWSFHVFPEGTDRCRLLSRSRAVDPGGLARLASAAMEPVTLLMTRKMLLGIKERAERERATAARSAA